MTDVILATLNGNGELHETEFGFYGSCNVPNCTWVTEHSPSRRSVQTSVRTHLGLIRDRTRWEPTTYRHAWRVSWDHDPEAEGTAVLTRLRVALEAAGFKNVDAAPIVEGKEGAA